MLLSLFIKIKTENKFKQGNLLKYVRNGEKQTKNTNKLHYKATANVRWMQAGHMEKSKKATTAV